MAGRCRYGHSYLRTQQLVGGGRKIAKSRLVCLYSGFHIISSYSEILSQNTKTFFKICDVLFLIKFWIDFQILKYIIVLSFWVDSRGSIHVMLNVPRTLFSACPHSYHHLPTSNGYTSSWSNSPWYYSINPAAGRSMCVWCISHVIFWGLHLNMIIFEWAMWSMVHHFTALMFMCGACIQNVQR